MLFMLYSCGIHGGVVFMVVFMEAFKTRTYVALGSLLYWLATLPRAGRLKLGDL